MAKKPLTPVAAAPPFDAPNARQYYQDLFINLKAAYWEASDMESKDEVSAARDEAYEILTTLNEQDLNKNTAAFLALSGKVAITNIALKKIQTDITKITKNISTGASVLTAITKVLSIAPMFL